MDISSGSYILKNLDSINLLLGKNGSGKSTLLRSFKDTFVGTENNYKARYITPERGGVLRYEAGVEQSINNNPDFISNVRTKNQLDQFKQQSLVLYRRLELSVLRDYEVDSSKPKFQTFLDIINTLLDQVVIKREKDFFTIRDKSTDQEIQPDRISSGESEIISLVIECLSYCKEIPMGKRGMLVIDEPDVHLHPDLQLKFMDFLCELITQYSVALLIATHSTTLLGGLTNQEKVRIAFIARGEKTITFRPILDSYKKIIPIFGAHPLSNLFNEAPPLLVEGEDDERVWQMAVRTSGGKIHIYPVPCGDVDKIKEYEDEVSEIINSIYNSARAFSLRDRDDKPEDISDKQPITRMRLSCRAAENLILTNEVLRYLNTTWDSVKKIFDKAINQKALQHYPEIWEKFRLGGYDRKEFKLKDIRNTIIYLLGSDKSWEVLVGKNIGNLSWSELTNFNEEGSIMNYLGEKTVKNLLPKI